MEIFSILPSYYAKDSINRKFTNEELQCIEYHKNKTRPNTGNATSLDSKILNNQLLGIRSKIYEMLKIYTSAIISPANDNFKLKITQSWINYTEPGGFHHIHAHSNSIISGVVYLQTGEDDKIQFLSNKPEHIKIHSNALNQYNSETWWVPVKTGDIILFPSYQRHCVPNTNSNSSTRISLSFNTFADGVLGSENDLTHLSVSLN